MNEINLEATLYFTKLANDTAGHGNYDMTVHFRGGSIRRITVSGQGNVDIPKHIDRKGASRYLPYANFEGTMEAKVLHGTPVSHVFKMMSGT